jgi:hypothetical protein
VDKSILNQLTETGFIEAVFRRYGIKEH